MEEMFYRPLDIAVILSGLALNFREEMAILGQIWDQERAFIPKEYRFEKRKWLLDVLYWIHYWYDKPTIDAEFPRIQRDAVAMGSDLSADAYTDDCSDLDLFFKNTRLRILYGGGKDYVTLKRRTLMARYGYKRLSPALTEHFNQCTYFYHLQPYLRDGIECKIENVGIDEMIIFRVI